MTQTYKKRVSCAFSRHAVEDIAAEADASLANLTTELATVREWLHKADVEAELQRASLASKDAEIATLREEMARAYELIVLGSVQGRKLERDQYLRQAAVLLDSARKKG